MQQKLLRQAERRGEQAKQHIEELEQLKQSGTTGEELDQAIQRAEDALNLASRSYEALMDLGEDITMPAFLTVQTEDGSSEGAFEKARDAMDLDSSSPNLVAPSLGSQQPPFKQVMQGLPSLYEGPSYIAADREHRVVLGPSSYLRLSGETAANLSLRGLAQAQEKYPQADLTVSTLLHTDFGGESNEANLTIVTATAKRKLIAFKYHVEYALVGLYNLYRELYKDPTQDISTLRYGIKLIIQVSEEKWSDISSPDKYIAKKISCGARLVGARPQFEAGSPGEWIYNNMLSSIGRANKTGRIDNRWTKEQARSSQGPAGTGQEGHPSEGSRVRRAVVQPKTAGEGQGQRLTIKERPEVYARLDKRLRDARAEAQVEKRNNTGLVTGGTIAVAETDLPLELDETKELIAGSARAGKWFDTADGAYDLFPPPSFYGSAAKNHAEQGLVGKISQAIEQAGLENEALEGHTVSMHVEQIVCGTCKAGLARAVSPGVLKQFSQKYPGLIVEITNQENAEVVRVRGGRRIITLWSPLSVQQALLKPRVKALPRPKASKSSRVQTANKLLSQIASKEWRPLFNKDGAAMIKELDDQRLNRLYQKLKEKRQKPAKTLAEIRDNLQRIIQTLQKKIAESKKGEEDFLASFKVEVGLSDMGIAALGLADEHEISVIRGEAGGGSSYDWDLEGQFTVVIDPTEQMDSALIYQVRRVDALRETEMSKFQLDETDERYVKEMLDKEVDAYTRALRHNIELDSADRKKLDLQDEYKQTIGTNEQKMAKIREGYGDRAYRGGTYTSYYQELWDEWKREVENKSRNTGKNVKVQADVSQKRQRSDEEEDGGSAKKVKGTTTTSAGGEVKRKASSDLSVQRKVARKSTGMTRGKPIAGNTQTISTNIQKQQYTQYSTKMADATIEELVQNTEKLIKQAKDTKNSFTRLLAINAIDDVVKAGGSIQIPKFLDFQGNSTVALPNREKLVERAKYLIKKANSKNSSKSRMEARNAIDAANKAGASMQTPKSLDLQKASTSKRLSTTKPAFKSPSSTDTNPTLGETMSPSAEEDSERGKKVDTTVENLIQQAEAKIEKAKNKKTRYMILQAINAIDAANKAGASMKEPDFVKSYGNKNVKTPSREDLVEYAEKLIKNAKNKNNSVTRGRARNAIDAANKAGASMQTPKSLESQRLSTSKGLSTTKPAFKSPGSEASSSSESEEASDSGTMGTRPAPAETLSHTVALKPVRPRRKNMTGQLLQNPPDPLFQALWSTEQGREALKTEYLYGKGGKLFITNGTVSTYDAESNTISIGLGDTGNLNKRLAQKRMIHEQTHRWYDWTGKSPDPLQYPLRPEDYVEPMLWEEAVVESNGIDHLMELNPADLFTAKELIYVNAYREGYRDGYNALKKMMPWAGEEQEELLRAEGRKEGRKRGIEELYKAFKDGRFTTSTSTKENPESYPEYYTKQWYAAWEGQTTARIRPAPGDPKENRELTILNNRIAFLELAKGQEEKLRGLYVQRDALLAQSGQQPTQMVPSTSTQATSFASTQTAPITRTTAPTMKENAAGSTATPLAPDPNVVELYRAATLDYAIDSIADGSISSAMAGGTKRSDIKAILAHRTKEEIVEYVKSLKNKNSIFHIIVHGIGIEHEKEEIISKLSPEMQKEFQDKYQKHLATLARYRKKRGKAQKKPLERHNEEKSGKAMSSSNHPTSARTSSSTTTLHADLPKQVREVFSTNTTHITKQHVEVGIPTPPDSKELLRRESQLQSVINTDQAATSQAGMPQLGPLAAEIDRIVGFDSFSSAVNGAGMYSKKRSRIMAELLDNKYSDQDVADYINSFDIELDDTKQFYLIHKGLNDRRRYPVWSHLSLKAQYSYTRRGKQAPKPVAVSSSTPQAMPRNKRLAEETGEQGSASKKQRRQVPMPRDFVAPMQPTATPLATISSTLLSQPAINTDQAATSQADMLRPGTLAAEIDRIVGFDNLSSAVNGDGMYSKKRSEIMDKLLDDEYSDQDVADYINSFDNEPNDTKQYYLIYRGLDGQRRRDVWRLLSSTAQNSYTRRGKKAPKFSSTPQAMLRNKRLAEETGEQGSASKKQRRQVPMPRDFVAPMQPTATPLAISSSTHSLQQDPFGDQTAKSTSTYTSTYTSSSANAFSSTHRAAPRNKRSVDAVEKSMDQFHQSFKSERLVFSGSINGIADDSDCKRYALLTMNRLVFLTFLQKKGFLDGKPTYLQTHLTQAQTVDGEDGTSYQAFLSKLFHNGLNQPARSPEQPFGKVPYLKIDLFDQHQLENDYPELKIPNRAYNRLLDFFERYYWQLDDAAPQGEADINPETFSRTLELMANLKETASYYTKKDVAEYISTNAIIPSLFDELQKKHPEAFSPESPVWSLLSKDFGGTREQIAGIEDLITSNLDGRTFAQRFITTCESPEILLDCYETLEATTILDPTCGTGAFLFAASNILAPLYEASLIRMRAMVDEYDQPASHTGAQEPAQIAHFRTLLQEAEQVPLRYFALKSLISKNLYGVDIMSEAIEVSKLCFNLKLLAQVDNPEELREVSLSSAPAGRDVNVRVGNTLVGFDWKSEFQQVMQNGRKFRVIVGNPPYGKIAEINLSYTIPDTFETLKCGDLYPCVVEKSQQLLSDQGYMGMIIPLAAFGTKGKLPLLERFYTWFPRSWVSFYHYVPGNLFDTGKGAHVAVAIFVAKPTGEEQRFSTKLRRWENFERDQLFSDVRYTPVDIAHGTANHYYPKFGSRRESRIMGKIRDPKHPLAKDYFGKRISDDNGIWYRNAGGPDWKIFRNTPWLHKSGTNKVFYVKQNYDRDVFVALFNSSLFWWYCNTTFEATRQTAVYMIKGFPFPYPQDKETIDQLTFECPTPDDGF